MQPTLADQFAALWASSDSPPDVFAFLTQHPDADTSQKVAVLLLDQRQRWKSSQPFQVECYLDGTPDLAGDPQIKVQLAVGEYEARQHGDSAPRLDEFLVRFADVRDTLRDKLSEPAPTGNGEEFPTTLFCRPRRACLDTNVLLDLLLNRSPWAGDAKVLWEGHRQCQIRVLVAAFSLPAIFYVVRKQGGLTAARTAVQACLTIAPTDQASLLAAQSLAGFDFEDDLQVVCAVQAGVDAIVTRDPRGFAACPIPIMTPADAAASMSDPTTP